MRNFVVFSLFLVLSSILAAGAPVIGTPSYKGEFTDNYTVSVNERLNISVSVSGSPTEVYAYIWYPGKSGFSDTGSAYNLTLIQIGATDTYEAWFNFTNKTGNYDLQIFALNASGEDTKNVTDAFFVFDNATPLVLNYTINATVVNALSQIRLSMNCSDDYRIFSSTFRITDPVGNEYNLTQIGNSNFTENIVVFNDTSAVGRYFAVLECIDEAGNLNNSTVINFSVYNLSIDIVPFRGIQQNQTVNITANMNPGVLNISSEFSILSLNVSWTSGNYVYNETNQTTLLMNFNNTTDFSEYNATVTINDSEGTIYSVTRAFVIDNVAPGIDSVSVNQSYVYNGQLVRITINASDDYQVDRIYVIIRREGATVYEGTTYYTQDSVSREINLTTTGEGKYTINATVWDLGNNNDTDDSGSFVSFSLSLSVVHLGKDVTGPWGYRIIPVNNTVNVSAVVAGLEVDTLSINISKAGQDYIYSTNSDNSIFHEFNNTSESGNYTVTVSVNDSYGFENVTNSSFEVFINPYIESFTIISDTGKNYSDALQNESFDISMDIYASMDNVSMVYANVSKPDGASFLLNLSRVSGDPVRGTWRTVFDNVTLSGIYNVSIYANDTTGNTTRESSFTAYKVVNFVFAEFENSNFLSGQTANFSWSLQANYSNGTAYTDQINVSIINLALSPSYQNYSNTTNADENGSLQMNFSLNDTGIYALVITINNSDPFTYTEGVNRTVFVHKFFLTFHMVQDAKYSGCGAMFQEGIVNSSVENSDVKNWTGLSYALMMGGQYVGNYPNNSHDMENESIIYHYDSGIDPGYDTQQAVTKSLEILLSYNGDKIANESSSIQGIFYEGYTTGCGGDDGGGSTGGSTGGDFNPRISFVLDPAAAEIDPGTELIVQFNFSGNLAMNVETTINRILREEEVQDSAGWVFVPHEPFDITNSSLIYHKNISITPPAGLTGTYIVEFRSSIAAGLFSMGNLTLDFGGETAPVNDTANDTGNVTEKGTGPEINETGNGTEPELNITSLESEKEVFTENESAGLSIKFSKNVSGTLNVTVKDSEGNVILSYLKEVNGDSVEEDINTTGLLAGDYNVEINFHSASEGITVSKSMGLKIRAPAGPWLNLGDLSRPLQLLPLPLMALMFISFFIFVRPQVMNLNVVQESISGIDTLTKEIERELEEIEKTKQNLRELMKKRVAGEVSEKEFNKVKKDEKKKLENAYNALIKKTEEMKSWSNKINREAEKTLNDRKSLGSDAFKALIS